MPDNKTTIINLAPLRPDQVEYLDRMAASILAPDDPRLLTVIIGGEHAEYSGR